MASAHSGVLLSRLSTYSANPVVRAAMKSGLVSCSWTTTWAMALNKAVSVPGSLAQPQRRVAGHLGLAGIDDDQGGAVLVDSLLEEGGDHRMGLGRVGADDHEALQVRHLGDAVAHSAGADGQLQAADAAGVAQPRAVVDVVGADHLAQELLQEVVVLVAGLGAGVGGDAVRPVARPQVQQPRGHQIQRLVPGRLPPVIRAGGCRALARPLRRLADQAASSGGWDDARSLCRSAP